MESTKNLKEYKCDYYSVMARENSCFFCRHCTDIFFDYSNGPYLFICEKGMDADNGIGGTCKEFEQEQE